MAYGREEVMFRDKEEEVGDSINRQQVDEYQLPDGIWLDPASLATTGYQ
jgi:hypothetical protein